MREERLIERIRAWEKDPDMRDREDPRKVIDSVLSHLKKILNTRQGSVQIASDYGVPDFIDLMSSYSDALRDIERSLKHTIQKYEPRLTMVKVKFEPQDDESLTLRFKIVARMLTREEKIPVLFESYVSSDGKVNIRS